MGSHISCAMNMNTKAFKDAIINESVITQKKTDILSLDNKID